MNKEQLKSELDRRYSLIFNDIEPILVFLLSLKSQYEFTGDYNQLLKDLASSKETS